MPKETVGIWNGNENLEDKKPNKITLNKFDQNGNITNINEWAAESVDGDKRTYFILTTNNEPKHKDYFQSNINNDKLKIVSKDIFLSYLDYLQNASQTSYKLATSEFKLNGYGQ